jgi:hypothetical protein
MSSIQQSGPNSDLELRIAEWASKTPDIRAVFCYGSRASTSSSYDEFSDLDLILFAPDPGIFALDVDWLEAFADIWLAVLDSTGAGDHEWFVLYAGGRKVDMILSKAESDSDLDQLLERSPYAGAFARGIRTLYLAPDLAPTRPAQSLVRPSSTLLEPTNLEKGVNRAIMSVVKASMLLGRGELFRGLIVLDRDVRKHLLVLVELHAKVVVNPHVDTWYDGRLIEQ